MRVTKYEFEAFTAGFNAARAVKGDSTEVKRAFETAWKLFIASKRLQPKRFGNKVPK